jgi:PBP1b-binding outer membrane lipoprotein LpoB
MKAKIAALTLILAGCGGPTPAENKADQLENAAEQSTPGAAQVLENAADRIEEGNGQNADAEANRALDEAGQVAANEQ